MKDEGIKVGIPIGRWISCTHCGKIFDDESEEWYWHDKYLTQLLEEGSD